MSATPTLVISPMRPDEVAFVARSTKMSLRHSREFEEKSNEEAFAELNPVVNRMMAAFHVAVAHRVGNPRRALGFVIFRPDPEALTVGFIYTRQDERRAGVARALLAHALSFVPDDAALDYVFPTARFDVLAASYGFDLIPQETP